MASRGIEELASNVRNLFRLLRQTADLLLMLPSSEGLFNLAVLRGKVAENMAAIRVLRRTNAVDVSELDPGLQAASFAAGSYALPFPPPSLTYADPPERPREFPLRSHNLSEEAERLMSAGAVPSLEFESFSAQELQPATERHFSALMDAVYAAAEADVQKREAILPTLARTRAEFVSHLMALNMLPGPGATIGRLPSEDQKILAVVHRWAVPQE